MNTMTETNEIIQIIKDALFKAIKKATTKAPDELINILNKTMEMETSELAIEQYKLMLDNIYYGADKEIPICQDTGVLNFFIELGNKFPIISNFKDIVDEVVENSTKMIPIRGNTVDPITNENPENNLGVNAPPIYVSIKDDSSNLKITVLPKGGGAENISRLFMLNPSNGLIVLKEKILNALKEAGGMPCPPVILGIGIGGDASYCMKLAKEALLRPLNQRASRRDVASLEMELLNEINALNIGAMGLGGKTSCLDVHIEIAMRHPASFPVGLIVQCYSHRWASFELNQKGVVIYES